jgi:hypothetical protein
MASLNDPVPGVLEALHAHSDLPAAHAPAPARRVVVVLIDRGPRSPCAAFEVEERPRPEPDPPPCTRTTLLLANVAVAGEASKTPPPLPAPPLPLLSTEIEAPRE